MCPSPYTLPVVQRSKWPFSAISISALVVSSNLFAIGCTSVRQCVGACTSRARSTMHAGAACLPGLPAGLRMRLRGRRVTTWGWRPLLRLSVQISGSAQARGWEAVAAAVGMLHALQRHLRPSPASGLATAAPTDSGATNAVVAENLLPGSDSSEWDVNGAGDPTIQGFATRMSVLPGETVELKVDSSDATEYRVDIYRLGYYSGKGARKVDSVQPCVSLPQSQPPPVTHPPTGLVDCDNWAVSARWIVPADAVSGLYIARLTRPEPSKGWRQDNTQTAGGAWMTGAPDAASASKPGYERLPAHDLDDEEQPVPNRTGWEHSYAANGVSGRLRNPIKEPRASHVYFVVRATPERVPAILVQTADTTWQVRKQGPEHE